MFFNQAVDYITRYASRLCLFGLMAAALVLASCGGSSGGGGGGGGPARLDCIQTPVADQGGTNWVCQQGMLEDDTPVVRLLKQAKSGEVDSDDLKAFLILSCVGDDSAEITAGFFPGDFETLVVADEIAEIRGGGEYMVDLPDFPSGATGDAITVPAHTATWDTKDASFHIKNHLPCMPQ